MQFENDSIDESTNMQDIDKHSPLQLFRGTEVNTNIKHLELFEYSIDVLVIT